MQCSSPHVADISMYVVITPLYVLVILRKTWITNLCDINSSSKILMEIHTNKKRNLKNKKTEIAITENVV